MAIANSGSSSPRLTSGKPALWLCVCLASTTQTQCSTIPPDGYQDYGLGAGSPLHRLRRHVCHIWQQPDLQPQAARHSLQGSNFNVAYLSSVYLEFRKLIATQADTSYRYAFETWLEEQAPGHGCSLSFDAISIVLHCPFKSV